MSFLSRENAKLATVAGFCLVVGLAGPSTASSLKATSADNADKVDGKHAVSFGASPAVRAGKLVATSANTGRLPNNIIAKAPNAEKLDGINSTGFALAGHNHDSRYYTKAQSDGRYLMAGAVLSVPSDERFAILYPLSGGTVGRLAIRGDASIRDASDPTATVTKVGTGQYCIKAPSSLEGAVGSLQNQGGGTGGSIRVSMGIGSFCNGVAGTNITVETFRTP